MGGTVLAIGVALLVLPGPAFIIIPAGLAILATEFVWARRLKDHGEHWFRQWREARQKRRRAQTREA